MILSGTQAKGLFTQKVAQVFKESATPTGFLRSFFTVKEHDTRYISTEITRENEKIAFDIERGGEARRNTFSKSTENIYEPPFYHEYFDATELDFYDRLFASNQMDVSANTLGNWAETVSDKLMLLKNKIERSYELQASQALEDGIVSLAAGDNIDMKRLPESKVLLTGADLWTDAGSDPLKDIEDWCEFVRTKGKAQGVTFNLIMGKEAKRALYDNDKFKETADLRRVNILDIREPQRTAVGGTSHGTFSAGDYNITVWTYPEYYDDNNGNSVAYLNEKKVVLLPENPTFVHAFAAVPQIVTDVSNAEMNRYIQPTQGQYFISNYVDERRTAHLFEVKSAGACITTSVNQVFTAEVVG